MMVQYLGIKREELQAIGLIDRVIQQDENIKIERASLKQGAKAPQKYLEAQAAAQIN